MYDGFASEGIGKDNSEIVKFEIAPRLRELKRGGPHSPQILVEFHFAVKSGNDPTGRAEHQ